MRRAPQASTTSKVDHQGLERLASQIDRPRNESISEVSISMLEVARTADGEAERRN